MQSAGINRGALYTHYSSLGELAFALLADGGVVGVERTSVDSGRLHDPLDGLEDRPTGPLRPDVDLYVAHRALFAAAESLSP
ncbi:hypothetical protein [Cutibacterium acnes]|uniref:hypothetical protein n=1 Tax=Cutibacterium acnes TaxID=1747 RepID=UPI000C30A207|nr:hypothetical protein [Cutibacterium acnes]PKC20016.1 hypothetical protein APS61_04620 [Cutibacterium acnes]